MSSPLGSALGSDALARTWRRASTFRLSLAALLLGWLSGGALGDEKAAEPLNCVGIENAFRVTPRIYSGGHPEGEPAFAQLRDWGIKTIISVDGTKPDPETAARYGLRYVHLPHGYEGIPSNIVLRLIKAVSTVNGPVFVHCHHGRHRVAAAVGVICQGTEGWTPERALDWMKQAGTSPDYPGLFRVNAEFKPPRREDLERVSPDFPAVAIVPRTVETMAGIDQAWDRLKAFQKQGWVEENLRTEGSPAAMALILAESYREMWRLGGSVVEREGFRDALRAAEQGARELYETLRLDLPARGPDWKRTLGEVMNKAGRHCAECHQRFRDR